VTLAAHELAQRQRTLAVILWITFGAAVVLGLNNLLIPAIPETIVLFAAAALCIPAMLLNQRGHYMPASVSATVIVLIAIVYNLYQGHGIHDSAVVAVPIFVMFGPLLFGRRALPLFLVLGIASVALIAALEMGGVINTAMRAGIPDVVSLSILVLCSGVLVWVIMSNLEGNLERARRSEHNLRVAYDHTLEGWAKVLEYRDRETEGHSRRVVNLCMRLAKEWGFSGEDMEHIHRGALLHDIGKLALPDEILFKRGPLSPGEWNVMRRHVTFARDMLKDIAFLRPALHIPYGHHEHWDGTGYPQGLKGRQIPIEARIFAVVDTYEALSSPRPYRKAWPRRKTVAYIRANAGKLFDPDVAGVFLRLHKEKAFGRYA
jgi:putative nucleotidyltransferase with HDIG domain